MVNEEKLRDYLEPVIADLRQANEPGGVTGPEDLRQLVAVGTGVISGRAGAAEGAGAVGDGGFGAGARGRRGSIC